VFSFANFDSLELALANWNLTLQLSNIVNTGGGAEHEVLFATARYDRFFPAAPKRISGLPSPQRLHQEETSLGNAKTFCHEALPYFA